MERAARLFFPVLLALNLGGCFRNYQLSETDLSDQAIQARVETQLRAQKGLDLRYVTVDVVSRVVHVTGQVNGYDDRVRINRIVNSISGVDQVILNLVIQE